VYSKTCVLYTNGLLTPVSGSISPLFEAVLTEGYKSLHFRVDILLFYEMGRNYLL
jgi:hypothetical protein